MSKHAVLMGSSMAGLGAARALASHFDRVTLIDRDALSDLSSLISRKGVPQGNHGHALLASGYRILDEYFPGMMTELVAEGASSGDATADFLWYQFGAWKLRADSGLRGIVSSRPLLEAKVRSRVRALPNVSVLTEHDIVAPLYDAERERVKGVRVKDRSTSAETSIEADLVIDATGRGSQSPKWLSSWGFGGVAESVIRCDLGYATGVFERRPGDFRGSAGGIITGTPPHERRGGAIFAIEGNRWLVTLIGILGDHPPTDLPDFRAFARSLPTADIIEIVGDRDPLMDLQAYRFDASRWRHYGKLARFPDGYLIVGDAICSFNPIYGQGMSVALSEAQALDQCLSSGSESLARRFLSRADKLIETPWTIAAGEDMRYPEVEGRRPPGFSFVSSYFERAHRASTRDPVVLKRLFEVASLLRPPTSMLSPNIALRVLLSGARAAANASTA